MTLPGELWNSRERSAGRSSAPIVRVGHISAQSFELYGADVDCGCGEIEAGIKPAYGLARGGRNEGELLRLGGKEIYRAVVLVELGCVCESEHCARTGGP